MFKISKALILIVFIAFSAQAQAVQCDVSVKNKLSSTSRIVVVSGTNRTDAMTLKIAEQVKQIAIKTGAEVDLVDISLVPLSTYRGDQYFQTSNAFKKKYDQKFEGADAIVFVFPEYDGSFPGILGTFLNFMRAPLNGKPVALVGLSTGALGGQKGSEHLTSILRHRKADVVGEAQVLIPNVESKIDAISGQVKDQDIQKRIENAIHHVTEKVKSEKDKINQLIAMAEKSSESFSFIMNSGARVQAKLGHVLKDKLGRIVFMKWITPTEILDTKGVLESVNEQGKIVKQDHVQHPHGFSSPIGQILVNGLHRSLSAAKNEKDLQELGLIPNQRAKLNYVSGVKLDAIYKGAVFSHDGKLQLLIFDDATMNLGKKVLYQKDWGILDLLVAESVESVRGI
jgi:NAD(P)H-dependent FMN reductase